jgi:hypothetical protein
MAPNGPAKEANSLIREYLKSRKNLPRLHDKVAVVSGAGSLLGIGRETVIAFCEHGAKAVYAVDIASPDDFASLRGLCAGFETTLITIYGDASDEASVSSVCRRAIQEYGRLDVFFANAGISSTECWRDEWTPALPEFSSLTPSPRRDTRKLHARPRSKPPFLRPRRQTRLCRHVYNLRLQTKPARINRNDSLGGGNRRPWTSIRTSIRSGKSRRN